MKRVSLNKVMAKLAVEQPEMVELNMADDNRRYGKGVRIYGKNIDIVIDDLEKAKIAMSVDYDNLRQFLQALGSSISRVESAAKELGINPNEVKGYKEALDDLQYGESQFKKAKKYQ